MNVNEMESLLIDKQDSDESEQANKSSMIKHGPFADDQHDVAKTNGDDIDLRNVKSIAKDDAETNGGL